MAPIAPILGIISTGVSAVSTIMGGAAQKAQADFQATQVEQQANETRAISQRKAAQKRREGELAQSRLLSLLASQGGSTTDATGLRLTGDVAEGSMFHQLLELSTGENRARGLDQQAEALRISGNTARKRSFLKAGGTILGGVGSFAGKFSSPAPADPWAGLRTVTAG